MRKIYYTIDISLNELDGGVFDSDGLKTINLYEIKDNEVISFGTIESTLSDNTEEEIRDWMMVNYNVLDYGLINL